MLRRPARIASDSICATAVKALSVVVKREVEMDITFTFLVHGMSLLSK